MSGLLDLGCRPLRIDRLQDSNGNDLDLRYRVGAVFSDKAKDDPGSIVRVVQASTARESSLPPESGLRPRLPAGGALLRKKRPAPENLREVSHESDVSGVRKHGKADLPDPGRAKRARIEDFVVLDSMDEAEIAGDINVRNWNDRNELTRSYISGEGYGGQEEEEDDDNESFKDALMGEAPAHSGGRISPSLGHHTPETEPTLPAPARRGSSMRITGVAALPPSQRTKLFEVKEEITSSPFPKMPEQAKHNPSPKVNGLACTGSSTKSRQGKHPSPSLCRRSHDSPVQTRSSLAHGSSASKHGVYRIPESSDDDEDDEDDDSMSVSKKINADSPRKRRSKSKSSLLSESVSSEADDESSQMQAARKLQKEEEEQERETLIRQAETKKQAEKEIRESKALASKVEAQAKREQQEAKERESRERAAKAVEERGRIEKERLEKERLKLLEQSKQEAAAGAKSALDKIVPETAVQAVASQEKASAKPTKEARRDTAHEAKLALRRERNARRKAEREAEAKESLEQIEQGEPAVKESGPNEKLALVEQNGENKAAPTSLEQPGIVPVEGNQEGSTVEKTGQRKPRVRSKSGKTVADLKAEKDLKTEKEAKVKEKELEKKEKQERQKVEREEKKRVQQEEKKRVQREEKERKAHEKKEAQESAKKVRQDQELIKVLEANVRATQEKDSQEKEPQSSSNESGSVLPPVLNSALKRKDPTTSAVKKPTHVSFADVNASSSALPVSSPIPWVMKRTPILPPGYIPKTAVIPQSEPSTAPPVAVMAPKPPPTTNGTAQIPLQSESVEPKQPKDAGSSVSQETAVSTQPKGKKSPQTKAAPVKKPEPKKSTQSKPEPKPRTESESDTQPDDDSESDSESVESAGGAIHATHATPTPGSKVAKIPSTPTPPMTRNLDAPSATLKPKTAPATPKPTVSKGKAKSAVTRYEELTDSSSPDDKQVSPPLPPSSSLPPTSAQRPKPSPPNDSGSGSESGSGTESEDESPALLPASTPAPVVLIKHPPTIPPQQSGSQRYKSLTDMEMDPIPDVRDVHQASRAAAAAAGKKRQSGSNSSQARKRQEVAEQESSDDSGSSYESSDGSEEEPETEKDALAGKRAGVPKKAGFGFRLA